MLRGRVDTRRPCRSAQRLYDRRRGLGRGENFNPQIDPIVRVEAIRLRAALARYYAGAGSRDPVVIEMPRGHYVAHFRWAGRSGPRMMWERAYSALQRLLAA